MSETTETSYDEVPYESKPFAQSHPDRLATVATLLGLQPPPVDRCRVLELGCASGGNILPMALGLPNSKFVGIDLSSRQIEAAQARADRLGLKNVELKQLSITDIDTSFGEFDYIISHGIYSWVPPPVQDHLLTVSARNLAPNGIAYVSYNTYPGWHMRGMIRDMMLYHGRHFPDPQVRIDQARALIDFLSQAVAPQKQAYGLLLQEELQILRDKRDPYLIHEYLEDVNDPIYFYQFVERAWAKGLQYLGEAQLGAMAMTNFPPEIEQTLRRLSPDLIHAEQYMDFLRNRMFRQSLLCHQGVPIQFVIQARRLAGLYISTQARPVSQRPDLRSDQVEHFRREGDEGMTLSSRSPLMKAAMTHLAAVYPRRVQFEELATRARALVGTGSAPPNPEEEQRTLGGRLLSCYLSSNLLEFSVLPPSFAVEVGETPVASPLARIEAERNITVTNLRHELVRLNDLERRLIHHLDGQHDRTALLDELGTLAAAGTLAVEKDGQRVTDPPRIRQLFQESLEPTLRALAYYGLLMK